MEIVPLEIAKNLKEKGFDWDKITTYNSRTKVRNNHLNPAISQVLKWLREEKDVVVSMNPYYGKFVNVHWWWDIRTPVYKVEICNNIKQEGFDSYELAALAGIEYVIDNLI